MTRANDTRFKMGIALGALLAGLSAMPALAQTSAEADASSSQLGDIIVTAQKREENLQATPLAVTALTSEVLAARGTTSLLDLNTRVPNLFVGGAGAGGRQAGTFFIRGVGIDVDTLAREPGVGLYIDDFYYGHTAGSLLSVIDVASVEVLRGPQGTLFGKNTIGGAIRYNSIRPDFTTAATIEGSLGKMERHDIKASVNLPLGDMFAVRISAASLNEDGYVRQIPTGQYLGDEHVNAIRAQLLFKSGKLTANLSADYVDSYNNGQPAHLDSFAPSATSSTGVYNAIVRGRIPVPFYATQLYAGLSAPTATYDSRYLAGPYESYATNTGYQMNGYGVNLTLEYELSTAFTLKSLTGWRRNFVFYKNDGDQSPLNFNQNALTQRLPSFSQEVQLLGDMFDGRLKSIVGLYYYRETPTSINDRGFPGEPDGNQQFDKISTRSKAAFAQFDIKPLERVTITLGGRYSEDTKDADILRTKVLLNAAGLAATPVGYNATTDVVTPTTATRFGPIGGTGSIKFTNFAPKAALAIQWTPDIMTYGSVSRGYRAGGFNNGVAVFNPTTLANPNNGILPFGNETAWSYEIGVRSELFDRRVRANVTLFQTDYEGLQISSSQVTGVGSASFIKIDNVGKARLRGIEGEFAVKLAQFVTLGGNFGYLDARYREIAPTVTAVTLASRLAGAPEATYSLYATVNPMLANGGQVVANVDWGHQSSVATATSSAVQILLPAYGLLNASLFYNFPGKQISIGVTGKNLLNERYLISGVNLVPVAAGNAGFAYTNIGRPRDIFATVRFKF